MKKSNYSLLLIMGIMWFSLKVSAVPYVTPVRYLEIPARTVDITFDGIADESSWSEAQYVTLFNPEGWDGTDDDFSGYLRLCWDMHYLYLFADITDDINHSLPPDAWDSWMFDCIEFHLDLDTNNHPSVTYDDNTIQLRFNRGIDSAHIPGRAQVRDFYFYQLEKSGNNGWILEAGIPWTCAMPTGYLPDDFEDYFADNIMGFDVAFSDSDNASGDESTGSRDVMGAWDSDDPDDFSDRTEDLAWCNTSVFGIIDLIGTPAPPPPPPPPPPEEAPTYIEPVNIAGIPLRTAQITIDGYDNEMCWSAEDDLTIFNYMNWEGDYDLDAGFKTCWDSTSLYVYANITDDVNRSWDQDPNNPSNYDNLEVYIDLDTFCIDIGYRSNSTISLRFCRGIDEVQNTGRAEQEDFLYSWRNYSQGNGWVIEVAIPWTCALASGSDPEDIVSYLPVIGFDMILTDLDTYVVPERSQLSQASWDMDYSDIPEEIIEDNAWYNTRLFGIANLLSTGVNIIQPAAGNEILMYPNPASRIIHLDNLVNVSQLEILSVTGQVLWTMENPGERINIDVSALRSGIYVMRVRKGDDIAKNILFAIE